MSMVMYGVGTTPFMLLVFAYLVARQKRYLLAARTMFLAAVLCLLGVLVGTLSGNTLMVAAASVGVVACVYDGISLLLDEKARRSRPAQQ